MKPDHPTPSLTVYTNYFLNEYQNKNLLKLMSTLVQINFLKGWYNACKQEHLYPTTLNIFLSDLENVPRKHSSSWWGR